jgi:hypothetical protein
MNLALPKTITIKTYAYDIESTIERTTHKHAIAVVCVRELDSGVEHTFNGAFEFFAWCAIESAITPMFMYAHNAAGYDAILLTQFLADSPKHPKPTKLLLDGNKVMRFSIYGCTFLDSYLHVSGSLNSLIDTFDLSEVSAKGFFPYTFYTPENRNYKGVIPALKYFAGCNNDASDELKAWYADYTSGALEYNIDDECKRYCINDVRILAAALECYRDAALVHSPGINPLAYPTIAAYAMRVYRTHHMPRASLSVMTTLELDFVRRAFKGGRCGVRTRHHEGVGSHIDVNGLYPSKQISEPMPAGAPEWIAFDPPLNAAESRIFLERLVDPEYPSRFALSEFKLNGIAPKLTHPVLLYRDGLRLAALIESDELHVESSPELYHALLAGYDISITRALVQQTRTDLFTSYINLYKNVKENATNAGQRALSKLMLNSLWGKLSQKARSVAPKYITSLATWNRMVEKHHRYGATAEPFDMVDSGRDWALTQMFPRYDTPSYISRTTAPSIACAITSAGRLELLRMLEHLDDRVMYYDTDSVIYRGIAATDPTPTREFGGWGNELEDGDKITEFIGIAPKVYAYKTEKGETHIRAKGMTVRPSYTALKLLAIDSDATPSITMKMIRFNIGATSITTGAQKRSIKIGALV